MGKQHEKAISDEECSTYPKDVKILFDLGYMGYKVTNLTVILPHKKPYKSELSLEQKGQNTNHSQQRVCNEHNMKGIKCLRVVKDIL